MGCWANGHWQCDIFGGVVNCTWVTPCIPLVRGGAGGSGLCSGAVNNIPSPPNGPAGSCGADTPGMGPSSPYLPSAFDYKKGSAVMTCPPFPTVFGS